MTSYWRIQKDELIGLSHLTNIVLEPFDEAVNFTTGPGTEIKKCLSPYKSRIENQVCI